MVRYEEPGGRKVHTYSFSIPWGHLDALGHVNNTRYFGTLRKPVLDGAIPWRDGILKR